MPYLHYPYALHLETGNTSNSASGQNYFVSTIIQLLNYLNISLRKYDREHSLRNQFPTRRGRNISKNGIFILRASAMKTMYSVTVRISTLYYFKMLSKTEEFVCIAMCSLVMSLCSRYVIKILLHNYKMLIIPS